MSFKLYSKINDYSNYNNYSISRNPKYNSKLYKKQKYVFNTDGKILTNYIDFIWNYMNNPNYDILYYRELYTKDDVYHLVLELDKYGKLSNITTKFLEIASNMMNEPSDFLKAIRYLLIPNVYKKDDICRYYLFKDTHPMDNPDLDKQLLDVYFKKERNRLTYDMNYSNEVKYYYMDDAVIGDALHTAIIYYYDTHQVINKKELRKLLDYIEKNQNEFKDEMSLNAVEYIEYEDWTENEETYERHKNYLLFVEIFCDRVLKGNKKKIR